MLNEGVHDIVRELYNDPEENLSPSVVHDLVFQIAELRKRMVQIRGMTDGDTGIRPITVTSLSEYFTCNLSEFLQRAKKKILVKTDEMSDKKKERRDDGKDTYYRNTLVSAQSQVRKSSH